MREHFVLGPDGEPQPCDLMTWARWLEGKEPVIAHDIVGSCEVSTIFLGVDHGFGRTARPVLWETMLFQPPHGSPERPPLPRMGEGEDAWETYHSRLGEGDGQQWRWCSRAEAVAGHAKIVEALKTGAGLETP